MIISVVSSKGGVGKTTLTANIAGYLADSGKNVLAVDADIQPTLSSYYELVLKSPHGLKGLITDGKSDVISRTHIPHLDLIYSDDPQGELHSFLLHALDGRQRLAHLLRPLKKKYDVILVDSQGAVGPLQHSAIFAGDIILSPIRPDRVSAGEFMRGTLKAVSEVWQSCDLYGWGRSPLYGLLYAVDRTVDARMYLNAITNSESGLFGGVAVMNTRVPNATAYRAAASRRLPVHRIDKITRGKTPCGADVISSLVDEILHSSQEGRANGKEG